MQVKIKEIDIEGIKESYGMQLKNEINKISDGNLCLYPDKYPALNKLYKLLQGSFDSSVNGVHFIDSRVSEK